jgi:carboxyl-terminal processing protease
LPLLPSSIPQYRRKVGSRLGLLIWAALLALLLAPPQLAAQSPDQAAAELVQEVFTRLRNEALADSDGGSVLRAAVAGVEQVIAGSSNVPAVPVLSGTEEDDLRAVATYVEAAVKSAPARGEFVLASALRAMIRAVTDPVSAVFTPTELGRYMADLRGEHGTIGVQVDAIGNAIAVVEVVEGGPAARAGIRAGDQMLDIDGMSVEGRTPDTVLNLLRGRLGSPVHVNVRRASSPPQRFSLIREPVREIPVRARMLEPRVGYLRLLGFTERANEDVERWLMRLSAENAQTLVLDLRDNGGGLVEEAVNVTSAFLQRGVVVVEEGRHGQVTLIVRPSSNRFAGPVVVLVNRGTASASEIVAGALQDAGVSLVGGRTFGKGTVQTIYFLQAGWGLRITTARYKTRAGRAIDGVGLTPDVPVVQAIEQVQGPGDTQLEIARLLARRRLDSTGQRAGKH